MGRKKKEILQPGILSFVPEVAKRLGINEDIAEKIYRLYWNQLYKEASKFEHKFIKIDGFGTMMSSKTKTAKFRDVVYPGRIRDIEAKYKDKEMPEGKKDAIAQYTKDIINLSKLYTDFEQYYEHLTKLREERRLKAGYKKPDKTLNYLEGTNDNIFAD